MKKKLLVTKETMRSLSSDEMTGVAGGSDACAGVVRGSIASVPGSGVSTIGASDGGLYAALRVQPAWHFNYAVNAWYYGY